MKGMVRRGGYRLLPDGLSESEIEAAKQARREYYREYGRKRYRENPERQKAANLRYWSRRAERQRNGGEQVADG